MACLIFMHYWLYSYSILLPKGSTLFRNASIVNAALISIEILSQKVSTTQVPIQTSMIKDTGIMSCTDSRIIQKHPFFMTCRNQCAIFTELCGQSEQIVILARDR